MDGTAVTAWVTIVIVLYGQTNCGSSYTTGEYAWHANITALDYYINYCGSSCGEEENSKMLRDPSCFPCSCSPSCKMYGTCCPHNEREWARAIFDTVDNLRLLNSNLNETLSTVKSANTKEFSCVKMKYFKSLLMVATCPESEKNVTLHELCTQELTLSVERFAPVSRAASGLTYRNTFCHQCNSMADVNTMIPGLTSPEPKDELSTNNVSKTVDMFLTWNLNISCLHYQTLYFLTSEDEFLQRAYEQEQLCSVSVVTPQNINQPEECDAQWYNLDKNTIPYNNCEANDPRLLWYCLLITHPAFRTSFRNLNLFCALCAGVTPTHYSRPSTTTTASMITSTTTRTAMGNNKGKTPPISFLLGITNKRKPDNDVIKCSNISWLNEKDVCEPALCSPGKMVETDGTCASVLDQIRGLGYKLHISLIPVYQQPNFSPSLLQFLEEEIYRQLSSVSSEFEFHINVTVGFNSSSDESHEFLRELIVLAYFIGSEIQPRDSFEVQVLELVKSDWTVNSSLEVNNTFVFKASLLGTELFNWYQLQNLHAKREIPRGPFDGVTTGKPYSASSLESPTDGESVGRVDLLKPYGYDDSSSYSRFNKTAIVKDDLWTMKDDFIDITHSLACPFVAFNLSDIFVKDDSQGLTFSYRGRQVEVQSLFNVSLVNEELHICIDVFKDLVNMLWEDRESALELAQYYFEIVCVSTSVVCLLMSFITYCLFPGLRSLPGLNNMSLCISLAVAHICLLIAVQHGVPGHLNKGYCLFHALVLHYAWLSAFLWMNVCCIHMYRVFTCHGPKWTYASAEKKHHLRYCLYAFGAPFLIIALTAGISLGVTSGKMNGYNNAICFLDFRSSLLPFVLALILPLCVTMVINAMLFFFTVREMVHVSEFQKHTRAPERQGVITYVKLSTLTGIFCIVCVLAIQLQSPVLSFLLSPLVALQGVFIFFSFTVNRRIWKLYADWLGCRASDTGLSDNTPHLTTRPNDAAIKPNAMYVSDTTESSRL